MRLAKRELPYQTAAFKELMTRYKDKVFAKATSMLENEEDARDISQEIFIKVLNNLPKFAMKAGPFNLGVHYRSPGSAGEPAFWLVPVFNSRP